MIDSEHLHFLRIEREDCRVRQTEAEEKGMFGCSGALHVPLVGQVDPAMICDRIGSATCRSRFDVSART